MRRWRLPVCRLASMSMWRSLAVTIRLRARCWSEVQKKYKKLVQMGTQRRSSPMYIELIDKIHGGLVGRAYNREGLVHQYAQVDWDQGKPAPVPVYA